MAQDAKRSVGYGFNFPKAYDQTQLKRFAARIKEEYVKEHQARASALVKDVSALAEIAVILGKALAIDPKAVAAGARKAQSKVKNASREVAPADLADILESTGHNAPRFPPYDGAGWTNSNGGIFAFESHGPDWRTGQSGARLEAYNSGHAYTAHDVGAFFFSNVSGTLNVTVTASVWGVAAVYSPLFAYSTAYAALRASISQWSPYRRVTSETVIYSAGSPVALNVWRTPGWSTYSATVRMPVLANTLYYLGGGAVQNAATGGLLFPIARSNFYMPVRPITFEVN